MNVTSQRLRYLSAYINQKDALPKDVTRTEWLLLWELSTDSPSKDLLRRYLKRALGAISGLWGKA